MIRSLAAALVLVGALLTPGVAHAENLLASCTGGQLAVEVDRDNGTVTGSGYWTDCDVAGHPEITSATASISGTATVRTTLLVEATTTDVITWNSGATTTETTVRTFTGLSTVLEVGAGASVSGLTHVSALEENATGTKTTDTSHFVFSIDDHPLRIIEVEGEYN